jgi:membrane protein YqaA with SNARE-associated domain
MTLEAVVSAFAVAALSAFVPVTPVEPYLVALAAGGQPMVAVGIAAAAGQTAGKLVIFLATRATLRSGTVRGWASRLGARYSRRPRDSRRSRAEPGRLRAGPGRLRTRLRRLTALLDRPTLVVPTVLLSAVTGVPPLLAVSVHAARTRVSASMFALCCLAGRAIRFLAIASIPGLL